MDATPNQEEAEFWSGPSGQSWIDYETEQDLLLSEVLEAVMARAGLTEGMRVLDIGCGTGALALAAAHAVGPTGRVLATDIAPPMINRLEQRAAHLPQLTALHADAEVADWPETGFDSAVSRFGVMFFAHPPTAFANIGRALRPGGKMTFATWAGVPENPYWRDPARIAAGLLGEPPKGEPNTPGPMGMADRDWSITQLRDAGLADVACEEVDVCLPIAGPPSNAATLAMEIGSAARVVRLFKANAAQKATLFDDLTKYMETHRDGDRVRIPARLLIYTATVR